MDHPPSLPDDGETTNSSGRRGLFDGFEGYQVPSRYNLENVLTSGLVVVDANVLLNLYRYTARTSDDLFRVLDRIGDRLWVPRQVVAEFWRNRLTALGNPSAAAAEAVTNLEKTKNSTLNTVNQWAKKVALDDDELDNLTNQIADLYLNLIRVIGRVVPNKVSASSPASDDPVLGRLSSLLDGRVGEPLPATEWEQCVAEGRRRVEALEPPGYRDASKDESSLPEGPSGDYLVWYQIIQESKRRGQDVALVTGDEKDDWWWRHRSEFLGPRRELAAEFMNSTGYKLFMLRPRDLLLYSSVLSVSVSQESVEDVGRSRPGIVGTPSWNHEGVLELLVRLDMEGREQADVIRAAADNGGFLNREAIYELCGYDNDRMLRGFTRPAARITGDLEYEGIVPDGVTRPLVPEYEGGVKAVGFRVPHEIVSLLNGTDSPGDSSSSDAGE